MNNIPLKSGCKTVLKTPVGPRNDPWVPRWRRSQRSCTEGHDHREWSMNHQLLAKWYESILAIITTISGAWTEYQFCQQVNWYYLDFIMTLEYSTYKMDFCHSWIVLDLESYESLKCNVQTRTENKSDTSVGSVSQYKIRENKWTSRQDKPTGQTLGK